MNDYVVEKELTDAHSRYVAVRIDGWLYRVLAVRLSDETARQLGGPWHVAVLSPWRAVHAFQGSDGKALVASYVREKLCPELPRIDDEQVDALTRTVGLALHRSYLLYDGNAHIEGRS